MQSRSEPETKAHKAGSLPWLCDSHYEWLTFRERSVEELGTAVVALTDVHGNRPWPSVSTHNPDGSSRRRGRSTLLRSLPLDTDVRHFGLKAKCLIGELEDAAGVADDYAELGGHARQAEQFRVWSRYHCGICYDVLDDLWRLANLKDISGERPIGVGIDGKVRGLSYL